MHRVRILLVIVFSTGILHAQDHAAGAAFGTPEFSQLPGVYAFTFRPRPPATPAFENSEWPPVLSAGFAKAAFHNRESHDVGFHHPQPSATLSLFVASAAARGAASSRTAPWQTSSPRAKAISYSDGYYLRLKIHRLASYATLPLFAAQFAVGQKLYDGDRSSSLRSAHSALAAGTAVLFGLNSVTGVWNLWEARKDPNGRGKRLLHAILMLGADAGFVATGALAPEGEEGEGRFHSDNRRNTHRTVAISSMAVATAGYLYMLLAK
jgi:hypothetical protein